LLGQSDHPLSARRILDRIIHFIRPRGLIAISTFSTKDHNYPLASTSDYNGKIIEEDTRGYRPIAFYSEERILTLVSDLELIDLKSIDYEENHPPDGLHKHSMWLVVSKKR